MALFNNEPEKNAQPMRPQTVPVPPAPISPAPERVVESPQQMAARQG